MWSKCFSLCSALFFFSFLSFLRLLPRSFSLLFTWFTPVCVFSVPLRFRRFVFHFLHCSAYFFAASC
uniref:Uncharacterized protein n=1 Tax=Anopheles darlingi TaxID=43151 RepID=A0A2M4D3Q2_ANODA